MPGRGVLGGADEARSDTPSPPGRRDILARMGVLGGGALIALVAAELVMRLYAFAPRVADEQFGFVPEPGALVRWNVEGNGHGHWNARGLRRQDNPADAPGILMLGDSITEAMQVDDTRTFPARLAANLRGAGLDLAVHNAGIAGASLARYASLAAAYQDLLHPRWTVVQFDEEDLTTSFSPLESHFLQEAPGGPLRIVKLPALGYGGKMRLRSRMLRARSALVQRVALQLVGFAREARNWRPFRADARPPPTDRAKGDPPIEEELALLADAYAGRITFLFIAAYDPARPDLPSASERRIEEICARRGYSLVNIRQTFGAFARKGSAPFGFPNSSFNSGHINEEGHEAVGRALAREIERLSVGGLL